MTTLGDRIRYYREGLLLTLEQLSERSGVDVGTISALENRHSTRSKYAGAIAHGLGLTVDELMDANHDYLDAVNHRIVHRAAPSVPSNASFVGFVATGNRIPVVGTAQLEDNGHFVDMDFPVGVDGFVDLPSRDPDAYAVRCRGDSMAPRIKHGEFVVVEPNAEVRPGDEVLVRSAGGGLMVKEFLYRREGRVHLVSANKAHGAMALDERDIEALHVVVAVSRSARYIPG